MSILANASGLQQAVHAVDDSMAVVCIETHEERTIV